MIIILWSGWFNHRSFMHYVKYLLPIGVPLFKTQTCTICTVFNLIPFMRGINQDKNIPRICTTIPYRWVTDWCFCSLLFFGNRPAVKAPKWSHWQHFQRRTLEQKGMVGEVQVRQCICDVNLQIVHMYQYYVFDLTCTCWRQYYWSRCVLYLLWFSNCCTYIYIYVCVCVPWC